MRFVLIKSAKPAKLPPARLSPEHSHPHTLVLGRYYLPGLSGSLQCTSNQVVLRVAYWNVLNDFNSSL